MVKDLWKLVLLKYSNTSDYGQKQGKEEIIAAFREMMDKTHHSLWRNYINGLVMFPEMTEMILEYIDKKGMSSGTVYRITT